MKKPYRTDKSDKNPAHLIMGKNAVTEALRAGRKLEALFVLSGADFSDIAKASGVAMKAVPREKLDSMAKGGNHQGILAVAAPFAYADVGDILARADHRREQPFIVILDHIEDPHNLGAIIRTAEIAGAHGVIIPCRRAAAITETVEKVAAGALSHILVAKVTNIAATVDELKKRGVWVVCADMVGEILFGADLKGAVAVVIGGEDAGVSPLVRKKCDFAVTIPMFGSVTSLNASVSAGIVLYEVARTRLNTL